MKADHPSERQTGSLELAMRASDSPTNQEKNSITLREYMMATPDAGPVDLLSLARSIAACVEKLHQRQLLHLDLRPECIQVHMGTMEPCSIDVGHAVHHSDEGYVRPVRYALSDPSLPYCSPENTGRMLRTVDERSDLYSLGVLFYEMLARCLPFQAGNSLEWEYMHLAQSPPPLTNWRTDLPKGAEAIIMRLLEKNPDRRYQNAAFLIADLDNIGRFPDTFSMDHRFHGREFESSVLAQSFYSACLGATEMVYVSGEAGIGKTSLIVDLFRNQQHAPNFFYITGKFEQLSKGSPYHAVIEAFRGLMRHLLGERKEQTERWAAKLRDALGSNAGVIAEMIPEAALLLGEAPPVEELQANESKKRFVYVFRKFVQALASKDHPLIIFIDDLHWADDSSLQLIHSLLCDPECQYLMVVGAYRPAETSSAPWPGYEADGSVAPQAAVRHIRLAPLSLEHINRFVAETLGSASGKTLPLTELLHHQSGGNPFHFKQILLRLQDDGVIHYDHRLRGWQWNLGQIIAQQPSFAMHDLMEHKLHRLSDDAQKLLRISACVGSTFHRHLVAAVAALDGLEIQEEWSEIEAEGLIQPAESKQSRFVHDHIQKLIYNRMEDTARQAIHSRIGQCLKDSGTAYEDNAFAVVNQLNRGLQAAAHPEEKLRLAQLNLEAGLRAKTSSAYDVALGYFRRGAELLYPEEADTPFEPAFELRLERAECEYLCGNYDKSGYEIDLLLAQAHSPLERSRVQMIRIMQYINQGKYLESTALGLESLRELGVFITPKPGKLLLLAEGMRTEARLRSRYDKLAQLEEMTDKNRLAAMNLIFAIIPSTFFTNKAVFFLLICRAVQLSLKYGSTPVTAAVYSAFGMLLGSAMGKYDKGYTLGRLGLELSERYNSYTVKSNTYTIFGGVLCQFVGDAREGDAYLTQALRAGLDSGNYVFASYAIGARINSLYTRASLSELARAIAESMIVLDTTNDEFVRQNFYLYQQVILALQGETAAPESLNSGDFDEDVFLARIGREETAATTLFQYSTYKTQLCYLLGRYDEAARWAAQADGHAAYATHLPHLPECVFYETLALTAASRLPPKRSPRGIKLARNLRRFKQWAGWSPANYGCRCHLLLAEAARASGDYPKAEQLYDLAVREAREQGDLHLISLANELAARYYEQRGKRKNALFYLQEAIEAYKRWGVAVKAAPLEQLERQWKQAEGVVPLVESKHIPAVHAAAELAAGGGWSTLQEPYAPGSGALNAVLRTTQALANPADTDTALAEIMTTIVTYAGASKGALLTGSDDALYVQAYADSDVQPVPTPAELKHHATLPEGIIRYVIRTQEAIHYTGAAESWVMHNPYFARYRPQTALCLPVKLHGTMLGVLYLENKLTANVFGADRLPVFQAMASHGLFICVLQNVSEPASPERAHEDEAAPGSVEEPLTDRELEVLALLAAGCSNKEIAEQLVIAVSTVKVHVKNIFAKLKVNRRTKAIAQAKELRLLG